MSNTQIWDISQVVNSSTAHFPGDVPFSKNLTMSHADSGFMNLTSYTMSPHVGTHADSPVHVRGELSNNGIGNEALWPYIGPCWVFDVAPLARSITPEDIAEQLAQLEGSALPSRVLFRTANRIRVDTFEKEYASFSPALVEQMAAQNVTLMGIDTPSVDPVESKTLSAHHVLVDNDMRWLENLDLTSIAPGGYFLSALPLKMTELEASPVRAVLLRFEL